MKKGKLSNEEMRLIRENCTEKSLAEISLMINRHEETIARYIERESLNTGNLTERQVRALEIKRELQGESFWEQLQLQLADEELNFFSSQYIEYTIQFERSAALSHGERMQIMHLIRDDILLNRNLSRQQAHILVIKENKAKIEELKKGQGNRTEISELRQEMALAEGAITEYTKASKELKSSITRGWQSLKTTRQQLTENIKDANTSFGSLVKAFSDEKFRDAQSGYINKFRAAMEKQRLHLMQYYEYMDGELDIPLLTVDTVKELDDE